MTRTWRTAGCALALTALLTSCSSDDGNDQTSAAPRSSDGSATADTNGSATGAGVQDADVESALAEQTVALPGSPDDKVTLGVLSLEVKGEVMLLRLAVTPDFASESDSQAINLFSSFEDTGFRPVLVDVENLKEYAVLKASRGQQRWASDPVDTRSMNGTPMLAYAYFAAPEDDIDTIDVKVTDFWPAFTDVPISR